MKTLKLRRVLQSVRTQSRSAGPFCALSESSFLDITQFETPVPEELVEASRSLDVILFSIQNKELKVEKRCGERCSPCPHIFMHSHQGSVSKSMEA